jgi:parallel beta-helix repeat protein
MGSTWRYFILAGSLLLALSDRAAGSTLYVDQNIASSSCTTYSPAARNCTGGTATAYKTLSAASSAAVAGDTVLLRAGTSSGAFTPAKSGSAGNPITYQVSSGETYTISGGDPAINLSNRSYLVIDGLTVTNAGSWIDGDNMSHVTLQNNKFNGPVSAFTAASFLNANYNKFLQNTFRNSGGDSLTMFSSDYNVIQGNTFTDADHSLCSIKCGNYNIFRGNLLSNSRQKGSEVFDCDSREGGVPVTEYTTAHNLIEGNTYALTMADDGGGPYSGIQYAAQNGILRNNVFYNNQGWAIDFTVYSYEAQNNRNNRFYNNVLYNNTGGINTSQGSTSQFSGNVVKNNILYKNKPLPIPRNDDIPGGSQMDVQQTSGVVVDNNDIFNNQASDLTIEVAFSGTDYSVSTAQSSFPSVFVRNLAVDPGFVSATGHDFRLTASSQVIDRGTFLTTTAGVGSGTSLTVADAGYFFDGYGIEGEVGDVIQLQGQTQTARITAINYTTNTLTLATPLTWTSGLGVALSYHGSAPDIGAYEYVSGGGGGDTTPPAVPKGLRVQ